MARQGVPRSSLQQMSRARRRLRARGGPCQEVSSSSLALAVSWIPLLVSHLRNITEYDCASHCTRHTLWAY